ncbi:hypothetical protein ACET3Z_027428 [Daucus carota]
MALFNFANPWLFAFGILGNFVSFLVYLAPIPTFYRIVKKKSSEGFHSIPYVIALFSAMLMIYYATLKTDGTLLITINSFGCVIEAVYISLYLAYAPRKALVFTLKLVVLLNFVAFWVIVVVIHFLVKPPKQVQVLGGINLLLSLSVFIAPLSIMKKVIKTKSVEFMPFWLSFFLSLSAVMWFFYGFLSRDIYVATPNILGFLFGMVQMVLYAIYRNCDNKVTEELKLPEIMKSSTEPNPEIHPKDTMLKSEADDEKGSENVNHKNEDASEQV